MPEKKYNSTTGVDQFHYGVLNADDKTIEGGTPERIKFLQDITVTRTSTMVRAYGDNQEAEIAVSNGPVSISGNFHTLPQEDQNVLFGLEVAANGLAGSGSEDNPPYVGVVFARTYEDGATEYAGLPKGKFLKTEKASTGKAGETTFSQDPISAEFMNREVAGFTKPQSYLIGRDEAGETTHRDAIFQAVFGAPYPTEAEPEPVVGG